MDADLHQKFVAFLKKFPQDALRNSAIEYETSLRDTIQGVSTAEFYERLAVALERENLQNFLTFLASRFTSNETYILNWLRENRSRLPNERSTQEGAPVYTSILWNTERR